MKRLSNESKGKVCHLVEEQIFACSDPCDFAETLDDLFFCYARYELTSGIEQEYAETVIYHVEVLKRFFKALQVL